MRQICDRKKSDYQYSATIVYNNSPSPQNITEAQKAAVKKGAKAVLDARAKFTISTLADLYDSTSMPPALAKAHADLELAVDRGYRKEPFPNDLARVKHRLALYEQLAAPLIKAEKPKRKNSRTRKITNDDSTAESYGAAAHFHGVFLREEGSGYHAAPRPGS